MLIQDSFIKSTKNRYVKTYYAIVNIGDRRLGTYVSAEDVAGAFKAATDRHKPRYPRLHVETITVQEMANDARFAELSDLIHARKKSSVAS